MPSAKLFPRLFIEQVYPEIDCGRYAAKRVVGERLEIRADILMDGHDELRAAIAYLEPDSKSWKEAPLALINNDRWQGSLGLDRTGTYQFTIKAWPDLYGSWAKDTRKKIAAGQSVHLETEEGRELMAMLLPNENGKGARKHKLEPLRALLGLKDQPALVEQLLSETTCALIADYAPRIGEVSYDRIVQVQVERKKAAFSAWYELFPRSQGSDGVKSGTLKDCESRLSDIHAMGFDVVYFPPIHPIGVQYRKGRNNALEAAPQDPGSPYAIGGKEGGHMALHPDLGSLADFRHFVEAAKSLDIEVALDFAVQVSRDHPYLTQHPEWFKFRTDGSLKYAENPPKKYQDIANVNFESGQALWDELRDIVVFWIEQGVTIFRVDNPHTKPFAFWQWLIADVQKNHPDIIFLSEAFTRPKIMYLLAKIGFTQSYSYFTWRNTKAELTQYLTELTVGEPVEFFRPNFFPTTPDIFPAYLHHSGRPGFIIRFVLAATLAGNYGIYSGYELAEGEALGEGHEEYLHSEKYEFKPRDWNAPGNFKDLIARVNQIRRDNPAMQEFRSLRFHPASGDQVLFYSKTSADGGNTVFIAVNLDYANTQTVSIDLPLYQLGIDEGTPYQLDDLLLGHSWSWTGSRQQLMLDPQTNPAAIFRINRS